MVITSLPTNPDADLVPPEHPQGEAWAYVLVNQSENTIAYADTASEVLGLIIDGYQGLDDNDAFSARFEHAVAVATLVQGAEMDALASNNPDAAEQIARDDLALTAVMRPKDVTLDEGLFTRPWSGTDRPRLYLVSTMYAPYQPTPAPVGDQVIIIDPYQERSYLNSLSELGLIELYTAE